MKKSLVLFLVLAVYVNGFSQHYYVDIISNQQSNANYKLLKQANVGLVKATSYEADNSVTENFMLQQQLSRDKKTLVTITTSPANITTTTVSLFANDRLKTTTDSLNGVVNRTDYEYDASGRLKRLTSQSSDPEHNGTTTEDHQWFYKESGVPEYMLKIKNSTDTVRVEFVYDEKGNIAEERWKSKSRVTNNYYYYYNDNNQLTDIVRYNARAKKMLPDYFFEYDAAGKPSQMMQTIAGTSNYLLWKYTYNENGLKQKEACYNKAKELVGRIEYSYSR